MTEERKRRHTVVFDLDGTLLDTLEDLAGSVNFALRENGYPERTLAEVRLFLGNGIRYLMRCAVPAGIGGEAYEKTFACFRQHYLVHCLDKTRPYAGVPDLLKDLKARHYRLAIVSNKLQPAVEELNAKFFSDVVTVAIGESKEVHRKPAPDTVLMALKYLESKPEDCVYVGDSEVDIETARNVGVPCISVLWGFRDRDFLLMHAAETLVEKPEEIREKLEHPL